MTDDWMGDDHYFNREEWRTETLTKLESEYRKWNEITSRITPLKSYSEYSIPHNHKYDWDKFDDFFAYTQLHLLHGSKNFVVLVSRAPVFFLNIFNMTVLRHDGHGPGDCLHYLSAVTDWWNHLLFTYLQELSRDETSSWSNCQMN
jgi:hypothetical protein